MTGPSPYDGYETLAVWRDGVEPRTYVLAAGVVLAALGASALVVRRRVARLNLIDVLKTRE